MLMAGLVACAAAPPPPEEIVCGTVSAEIPVPIRIAAPPLLTERWDLSLPSLVDPSAPEASSCVTPAGEQALLDAIDGCVTRVQMCRAWALE